MPFPSIPLRDDFNRADAGDLGANWSIYANDFTSGADIGIIDGEVYATTGGDVYQTKYWNPATFAVPCGMTLKVTALSVVENFDVFICGTVSPRTRYRAVRQLSDGSWLLRRQVAGTNTTLGTAVAAGDAPFVDGDTVGLFHTGSALQLWINGVMVAERADTPSGDLVAGYAGFWGPSNIGGSDPWRFDDFAAGEVVAPSTGIVRQMLQLHG